MSAPAAFLIASYVFGIAVVCSDIYVCSLAVIVLLWWVFLLRKIGLDCRSLVLVISCGITNMSRKRKSYGISQYRFALSFTRNVPYGFCFFVVGFLVGFFG